MQGHSTWSRLSLPRCG